MDGADATWAPQSPDLNSYYALDQHQEPVHPQHHGYRGSISHAHHAPYSPPSSSPILAKHALPPQPQFPLAQPHSQSQSQPDPHTLGHPHHQPYPQPYPQQSPYMPRAAVKEESMHDADYVPDALAMPDKSRGKRPSPSNGSSAVEPATPGADLVITHHFPVARIKRIMQADDDVGKVAQVTPVVVSKALELFMISLVTKAAAEAKARNSKRVATVHLKQAITKDEQFDFLSEIVSKVADAPAAADKDDPDAVGAEGKRRKASGRRKKKADEDDL